MNRNELLIAIITNLIHIKRFHLIEEDVPLCGDLYCLHVFPYENRTYYSNVELYIKNNEGSYITLSNIITAERSLKFQADYSIDKSQLSITNSYDNSPMLIKTGAGNEINRIEIIDINDEEYESKLFQMSLVQEKNEHEMYEIVCNVKPLLKKNMEAHFKYKILEFENSQLETILDELKNFVSNRVQISIEEANEI